MKQTGLHDRVKMVTPLEMSILGASYPPSAGQVADAHLEVVSQLVKLLVRIGKEGAPCMSYCFVSFLIVSVPCESFFVLWCVYTKVFYHGPRERQRCGWSALFIFYCISHSLAIARTHISIHMDHSLRPYTARFFLRISPGGCTNRDTYIQGFATKMSCELFTKVLALCPDA